MGVAAAAATRGTLATASVRAWKGIHACVCVCVYVYFSALIPLSSLIQIHIYLYKKLNTK